MGRRLGMMRDIADHLLQVPFNGKANGRHRSIRGLILKRVLQVDRHFFDQEKYGADGNNDRDAHEAKKVHHRKREQ